MLRLKLFTILFALSFPGLCLGEKLEFSEQVITFDKLSYLIWNSFAMNLPSALRMRKSRVLPNGDTQLFSRASDSPFCTVKFRTNITPDKTRRQIQLQFMSATEALWLEIRITTIGSDLELPPLEDLRAGMLPFVSTATNESWHEVKMTPGLSQPDVTILTTRTGDETIAVSVFSNGGGGSMNYVDHSEPYFREISYSLYSSSEISSLKVQKHKLDNMTFGSETYFVNNEPSNPEKFHQLFKQNIFGSAAQIGGLASFLTVLQTDL